MTRHSAYPPLNSSTNSSNASTPRIQPQFIAATGQASSHVPFHTPSAHFSFQLLPVEGEDIPALARLHVSSLKSDLLYRLYFPSAESHFVAVQTGLTQQFRAPDYDWWFVKAVDKASGSILGWAAWTVREADLGSRLATRRPALFPLLDTPVDEGLEAGDVVGELDGVTATSKDIFAKPGLLQYVHSHTQSTLDDWYLGKRHALCHGIYVDPAHQHLGIGSELLKWGDDKADKDGIPSFTQSTPAAYSLFKDKDAGFKDVGNLEVDLAEWVSPECSASGYGKYKVSWLTRLPCIWGPHDDSPAKEKKGEWKKLTMKGREREELENEQNMDESYVSSHSDDREDSSWKRETELEREEEFRHRGTGSMSNGSWFTGVEDKAMWGGSGGSSF